MSDEACMERIRGGDLHGFAPLYDHHHVQARLYAAAMAGRRRGRDLTDEAFGRLLLHLLDGHRPDMAVRYFLYAALRESHRLRVAPGLPRPDFPGLPRDWRTRVRGVATHHVVDEQAGEEEFLREMARAARRAPFLCRTTEILLGIADIAPAPVSALPREEKQAGRRNTSLRPARDRSASAGPAKPGIGGRARG